MAYRADRPVLGRVTLAHSFTTHIYTCASYTTTHSRMSKRVVGIRRYVHVSQLRDKILKCHVLLLRRLYAGYLPFTPRGTEGRKKDTISRVLRSGRHQRLRMAIPPPPPPPPSYSDALSVLPSPRRNDTVAARRGCVSLLSSVSLSF